MKYSNIVDQLFEYPNIFVIEISNIRIRISSIRLKIFEYSNIRHALVLLHWTIKEFGAIFIQYQSGGEKTKTWASLVTYFPRIEKYSNIACGP